MVTADQIIELVNAVAEIDRPDAIILFGSYAYGVPDAGSDVDLLVVRDYEGASPDHAARIYQQFPALRIPLDLIVRSRAEITKRISMRDWFLKEITEMGVTLYASDDDRVGRQGRARLQGRLPARAGVQGDAAARTHLLQRPAVG